MIAIPKCDLCLGCYGKLLSFENFPNLGSPKSKFKKNDLCDLFANKMCYMLIWSHRKLETHVRNHNLGIEMLVVKPMLKMPIMTYGISCVGNVIWTMIYINAKLWFIVVLSYDIELFNWKHSFHMHWDWWLNQKGGSLHLSQIGKNMAYT